jgi:1-acyl-sn-glycerol-3-phosphate acyltransferase
MLDHFPFVLAKDNNYETPFDKNASLFGPTFTFYYKLAKIFIKGNLAARRGEYNGYAWAASAYEVMKALEESGVKIIIEGMDNLKKTEGPAIIISNHMGSMETMVPVAIIHPVRKLVYVVKQELSTYPVFGKVVMARDPIVVGRSNPREDLKIVLEEGSERLKKGKSVLIFPQKTRSEIFNPKEFNSLGVKLAKKNNVPVIPMAILTDAWSKGKKIKDFGKIIPEKKAYFAFGEPINVNSNGQEEHEQVLHFIETKLSEWGRSDLVKR